MAKKGRKSKAGPPKTGKPTQLAQSAAAAQVDAVQRIGELMPVVLVCGLVLFQGGYYAGATCVIAVVALVGFAIWSIARRGVGVGGIAQPATFLFAIAVPFAVSSLANGPTVTTLLETASWFAVGGIALWCVRENASSRARMLDALAAGGAVLAGIGILMFAGIIPFEGAVSAGRLMFTFQYANTAGLFFAVIAVLCLCSKSRYLRFASVVPIVALACTQSVGALGVFACALVALGVRYVHAAKPDARIVAGATAGIVVVCIAGALALQGRLQQAAQTFIERIVQMLDALSVLGASASNAMLGIGPDSWQFTYPLVQTAQYHASNVHNSFLQIALDGGMPAMCILIALIVLGIIGLVRTRDFAAIVCTAMVSIHALFDFDFQFSSITLLLAILVAVPSDAGRTESAHAVRARFAICCAVAVCSLAASIGGIYLDTRAGEVQVSCARGEIDQAAALVQGEPLFANDASMRSQVTMTAVSLGDHAAVIDVTEGWDDKVAALGLYRTASLSALGRTDESLATLERTLATFPYDPDLYDAARNYIVQQNLSKDFIEAYNAQALHANDLVTQGHASWLSGQKTVKLIVG